MSTNNKPQSAFFQRTLQIVLFGFLPFVGLIVLLFVAGAGRVSSGPTEARVPLVEYSALQIQDQYLAQRRVVGTVEAVSQGVLGFELGGTLEATLVDEGQQVTIGQPLARLDTSILDAQLAQLKAALKRAQSNVRLAQLSERRVTDLVEKKLESPQRLDEVRENTVAAAATVLEVEAQITGVEVQLKKSALNSPFAGEVLSRSVDSGSVVGQGQNVFVIQQSDQLQVRIAMGAYDAQAFAVGEEAELYNQKDSVIAVVSSIAANRRLATQTVDVIFSLPKTNRRILPGDLLSLQFKQSVDESGAWVARQALSSGVRGLWTLYIVENRDGKEHVIPRSVEVLYSLKDKIYIRGPIRSGERYVVAGSHKLTPDQTVQVRLADGSRQSSVGGF